MPTVAFSIVFICSTMTAVGIAVAICNAAFGDPNFQFIATVDGSVKLDIAIIGFLGGFMNGLQGMGLATTVFCMASLYFRLNDQVATSSGIMVAASNSILNTLMRLLLMPSASTATPLRLFSCTLPATIVGSMLSVFILSQISSGAIRSILYSCLLFRYIVIMTPFMFTDVTLIFTGLVVLTMMTAVFLILGVGGYIKCVST
uniref:Uncharacterized protein n=1 Tax=Spongospora subterranea TaxID=70186 RepID=A0A0H5QGZ9_9EUKA|eukprot:CRZ00897.1 hypothetical protein [Spongospora subterranea]